MTNSVVLKGSNYGIIIILDDKIPFEQLKHELADKFIKASSFFKNADIVVSFKGRQLQYWEEKELVDTISENSMLNILYVLSSDEKDKIAHLTDCDKHALNRNTMFYKGTLQSGQVLESTSSIIIIGDVCCGSKIISNGNVVVLGSLKGSVCAGLSDSDRSFISALYMSPQHIRIGEISVKCSGKHSKLFKSGPNILYCDKGAIYLQSVSNFSWNNIGGGLIWEKQ